MVDIDEKWDHWKSVFFGILNRHAPVVCCCVRREALPWIDNDIGRLMRKRNRLRRVAGGSGDSGAWESYRFISNKVTAALRLAK